MSLTRAPLVPEPLLRRHDCLIGGDTRYRAAARLKQSLWREEQDLAPGLHHPGGRRELPAITLGSTLTPADAARGCNFLSPEVHAFVRRTLALREEGALINYERLHRNLLSSEPLNFNLLAPLAIDLDLATAVFRSLLPEFVDHVEGIRFETSPGRHDPRFLDDGTAFDAAVSVITPDGEPATVFVEVKYSEACAGPAASPRLRYGEVSRALGLHRDPGAQILRSVALEQFWRLSLLAGLCVRHGVTPRAHLLLLSPALNRRVAVATRLYADELVDPAGCAPETVGFTALTLEAFVAALHQAGAVDQAAYLGHRYLDLQPVLDLILRQPDGTPDEPPTPPAAPSPLALPTPSSNDIDQILTPVNAPTAISAPDAKPKPVSRRRRRSPSTPKTFVTPKAVLTRRRPRAVGTTASSALKATAKGGQ